MMQKRLIRSLRSRFHNYKFTVNGGFLFKEKLWGFFSRRTKFVFG
jgi:hypothetical protein